MITMSMYKEIQRFKRQGVSIRNICSAVGASRNTVRKYYRMNEDDFIGYLAKCRRRGKKFESYSEEIITLYNENKGRKVYTSSVFDVLEERHGELPASERTLRNYITYLSESGELDTRAVVRMYQKVPEAAPGSQMQVDFGVEKQSCSQTVYIFAALLSHSRYRYVAVQERPFTTIDVILHLLDCFIAFGGKPEEMVIDQDAVLVVSENSGDIIYTHAFKQFIDEQELSMRVCKKADPESKGKVENLVGFVKSSFFSARTFESFEQIPAALAQWLRRRANGRVTQATGKIPAVMLEEEQKSLRLVRRSVFEKEKRSEREARRVNEKGLISVLGNRYSVPFAYRNGSVDIYYSEARLFIFDPEGGAQIASHLLSPIKGQTVQQKGHLSPEKGSTEELYRELERRWSFSRWSEFLVCHKRHFARYLRQQYGQLRDLLERQPESAAMEKAIAFCLEVDQLSAKNLQEAYEYFLHVNEEYYPDVLSALAQNDVEKNRHSVRVEKRKVGYYSSLVSIVGGLL